MGAAVRPFPFFRLGTRTNCLAMVLPVGPIIVYTGQPASREEWDSPTPARKGRDRQTTWDVALLLGDESKLPVFAPWPLWSRKG